MKKIMEKDVPKDNLQDLLPYDNPEMLAAYVNDRTDLKVDAKDAYCFGTSDFTVTFLISADTEGIVLGSVQYLPEKQYPCGWYLELLEDDRLYFYTGDGESYSAVKSEPVKELKDGYVYFVTARRRNGELELGLETEILTVTWEGQQEDSQNVNCDAGLYIGGLKNKKGEVFRGAIRDVTLWSKSIDDDECEYVYNNVFPFDITALQGWWPLDGGLGDISPVKNPISNANNLSFVEIFDILFAESTNGYQYGSISQSCMSPGVDSGASGKLLSEKTEKTKKKIKISVQKKGVLMGCCNQKSPEVLYPDGVEVRVVTPSGQSITELSDTEERIIRCHGDNVWQFLFLNPEQGDWSIEVCADPESNFDFDCQFFPEDVEREEIIQKMYLLYEQYAHSEKADGVTPEYFLFTTIARIMALDIQMQKEKNTLPELCVGIATQEVLVAATVIICGLSVLGKTIKWIYNKVKEWRYPVYSWGDYTHTLAREFDGSYKAFIVYNDINDKLHHGSPSNPKDFYKRKYLDRLRPNNCLHLDLGGEGCFTAGSLTCGFRDAINVNTVTKNSQYKHLDIPFLVLIDKWEKSQLPFEDGMVDRITAQGTDSFTELEIDEIARCIRKDSDGKIDVWTDENLIGDFKLEQIAYLIKYKYGLSDKYQAVVKEKEPDNESNYGTIGFYKYSVVIEEIN